jgi:hypothetical protein
LTDCQAGSETRGQNVTGLSWACLWKLLRDKADVAILQQEPVPFGASTHQVREPRTKAFPARQYRIGGGSGVSESNS